MSPVTVALQMAESWSTKPPTAGELRRMIRCPIARAAALTSLSRLKCNLPPELAHLRRQSLIRARCMRNPATGRRYRLKDLAPLIDLSSGRICVLTGARR